jgi:hypothetical protein
MAETPIEPGHRQQLHIDDNVTQSKASLSHLYIHYSLPSDNLLASTDRFYMKYCPKN